MKVRELSITRIAPIKNGTNNYHSIVNFKNIPDEFVNSSTQWVQEILDENQIAQYQTPKDGKTLFIKNNEDVFENMLKYDKITDFSKEYTVETIRSWLTQADSYDYDLELQKAAVELSQKLDRSWDKKSPIEKIGTTIEKFIKAFSSKASDTNEERSLKLKYYKKIIQKREEIEFIKENKTNFLNFLTYAENIDQKEKSSVITENKPIEIKPVKPQIQEEGIIQTEQKTEKPSKRQTKKSSEKDKSFRTKTENRPLLSQYTVLKEQIATQEGEEKYETAKKINEIKKLAQDKNISLIDTTKFPETATNEERLKFFEREVYPVMDCSNASALAGLTLFEEFGFNTSDKTLGFQNSTLSEMTLHAIPQNPNKKGNNMMPEVIISNEVISKYLDVFDKYAKVEFEDCDNLEYFFERTNEIMDEKSALKYIKTLKKFMYSSNSADAPSLLWADQNIGRFKDNEEIVSAIEDLKEYAQTLKK